MPRGTLVFLGLRDLNRCTLYWGADAHEWKPARWLKPLPDALLAAHVPAIYANV